MPTASTADHSSDTLRTIAGVAPMVRIISVGMKVVIDW